MTSALGCFAHLIALAVITTLVDRATAASLPAALRPWLALVAGAMFTFGLSNVWTLARGYGQGESSRRALLRRARAGQPPSQDGPILATGVVRAEGPALVSPVTGQPCVAYQYRIYDRHLVANAQWETRVLYWGYAWRPFRLDTASEAVRVLAMPRFLDRPTRYEDVPEASARTEDYIRATRFETGAVPVSVASAFALAEGLFTEQRLEMRRDWQRIDAPAELRGLSTEEQVLPVAPRRRRGGCGRSTAAGSFLARLGPRLRASRW